MDRVVQRVTTTTLPIEREFQETFEEEWAQGSLYGWEKVIAQMSSGNAESEQPYQIELYCPICEKAFGSQGVMDAHMKGKKHLKAVEARNKKMAGGIGG